MCYGLGMPIRIFTALAAVFLFCFSACFLDSAPPPELNRPYPNLALIDEHGTTVPLSVFRGKVTLIHAVSMGCSLCQALSGSDRFGPFGMTMPAAGVSSLESYLKSYAPLALKSDQLQVVQIVFFDRDGNPPTADELREWSDHFHLRERGIVVLGAPMSISQTIGRSLVPGFQLLDRDLVLRSDSTGIVPRNDFSRQLLPQLTNMLREGGHPSAG